MYFLSQLWHHKLFHCKRINIFIGTLIAMMVFVSVADERESSFNNCNCHAVIASTSVLLIEKHHHHQAVVMNPSRVMWSRSCCGLLGSLCSHDYFYLFFIFWSSGPKCCGPAAKVLHYLKKNRLPLRYWKWNWGTLLSPQQFCELNASHIEWQERFLSLALWPEI